jgi:hypothetical protein
MAMAALQESLFSPLHGLPHLDLKNPVKIQTPNTKHAFTHTGNLDLKN